MISKQHHKHSKLARPAYGNYSRLEWAILGTTCEQVQSLAGQVISALSPAYKAAYLDATHKESGDDENDGKRIAYTSHPGKDEFSFHKKLGAFAFRNLLAETDYAFINGNHLKGRAQVVVIDDLKRASLEKRKEALTDIQLILLKNEGDEMYDFIKAYVPGWETIPVLPLKDIQNIVGFFKQKLEAATAPLNALVLAGGRSMRMGQDKTTMQWHGKEQRYYMADLVRPLVNEVFISCRQDQEQELEALYQTLPDNFTDLGPFGAILSAFRQQPGTAWLVVASDLPLLDKETLAYLVSNRRPSDHATTFNGSDGLPEPLITIWEPKSYPLLLAQLAQGYTCPRKFLLNNEVHILTAPDPVALMNVNTPEQAAVAKMRLEQKLTRS